MTVDNHAQSAYDANPRHHPGLRSIALVEGSKGLLALLGAGGLELIGPVPLQQGLQALIRRFQFDPAHGGVADMLRAINPHSLHLAALAIAAYGLLHVIEAWGLWRARAWASWLGCVSAAIYLPFEVHALVKHPGWLEVLILAINLLVVWVLARDLRRRHSCPQ